MPKSSARTKMIFGFVEASADADTRYKMEDRSAERTVDFMSILAGRIGLNPPLGDGLIMVVRRRVEANAPYHFTLFKKRGITS